MEQKEGKPSEDGTTVTPTAEDPGSPADGAPAEETQGTAGKTMDDPDGAGKQDKAPAQDGIAAEFQGEANGLDEAKVESQTEAGRKEEAEAELKKEEDEKEGTTAASQETPGGKEETRCEPEEVEEKQDSTLGSETLEAEEKEPQAESGEKADNNDKDKPEPQDAGGEEAREEARKEAREEAEMASQEEKDKREEPRTEPKEKAADEAKTDSQEAVVKDEAETAPKEADGKEEAESDAKEEAVSEAEEREDKEPGSPSEEQEQEVEKEPEGGAGAVPSSPEAWPESPTGEGQGLSPDGLGPDSAASRETSPAASGSSASDAPQSPPEPPPSGEKKKEKAPERRVSAPPRSRGPRAQNRKAIVDKFGGAASGPTALFRNTKAAGTAIGGVKNMLLEWCRAMTRNYEHVDIQNFSSSWSSGMAFCALIHKFFPDAFDYTELDPTKRRHNFTLAFSTAEKLADCAQLLEVDDMVRLAVPDSKCVYTYIQELYRSLVQKGLVKTKKK
ncbi:smoothelin-like protein 1 [Carlito syrichta]|uniref:Smoothelin-like protein 1 n=1 Tax=Carlito syrichta TaxID=1868482 RepID=A0A1U7TSA1_CARSF|nr:smoothelin-like protein 1 [Carlito syrichta]